VLSPEMVIVSVAEAFHLVSGSILNVVKARS